MIHLITSTDVSNYGRLSSLTHTTDWINLCLFTDLHSISSWFNIKHVGKVFHAKGSQVAGFTCVSFFQAAFQKHRLPLPAHTCCDSKCQSGCIFTNTIQIFLHLLFSNIKDVFSYGPQYMYFSVALSLQLSIFPDE